MPQLNNAAGAGFCAARLDAIRERVREWTKRSDIQGAAYVIMRHGVPIDELAVGLRSYKDRENTLTLQDRFSISSVTKPLTAALALTLVEDGKLSLTRPIGAYLPYLGNRFGDKILVHHLLTHTSGYVASDLEAVIRAIPFDAKRPEQDEIASADPYIAAVLAACAKLAPRHAPGSVFSYCGYNYTLLGEIIERTQPAPIGRYAQHRLFEPIGMTSTSYGLAAEQLATRVQPDPAIFASIEYGVNDPRRLAVAHPAGGIVSTCHDIARFAQMFLDHGRAGGRLILSPASVAAMTSNQIPGVGAWNSDDQWVSEASWGLGWAVQAAPRWKYAHGSLQPLGTFYHQGALGTAVWCDPLHQLVGVYFAIINSYDMGKDLAVFNFDLFQDMVYAAIAER